MVIRAAKEHQCSICKERVAKKPASLPHPRDVSDQVHMDILEAYDIDGEKYYIIHAIDFCTRFQMSQVLERKSAEDVIAFVKTRWMPIFGPMRVLFVIKDESSFLVSSKAIAVRTQCFCGTLESVHHGKTASQSEVVAR